jgi:hypothetical protein
VNGINVSIFHLIFHLKQQNTIMKKVLILVLFFATVIIFEFCTSSKKAQKSSAKISYASSVQSIVATSCSPCHVGSGARQKRLDSYDAVKNNIDEIVRRIQLNPGDKAFMPMKHPKLSDSTIQAFVQWRSDGFIQ